MESWHRALCVPQTPMTTGEKKIKVESSLKKRIESLSLENGVSMQIRANPSSPKKTIPRSSRSNRLIEIELSFFFSFSNQSRKRAACCRAVLLDCSPVFCPVERKNKEVKRKSIPRQKVKKSPTPKRDPDETNEKDIATGNRMAREGQPVAAILGPANAQANAKKKKRNK